MYLQKAYVTTGANSEFLIIDKSTCLQQVSMMTVSFH